MLFEFRKRMWFGACASGFMAFLCPKARANTVTATGGLQFGRNSGGNQIVSPTPILGAEYGIDFGPHFQLGGFYDLGFPKDNVGNSGRMQFLGVMGRFFLKHSDQTGPFVDGRIGLAEVSDGGFTTTSRLGYAVGAGYQFVVSKLISLGPRIGVRFLPDAAQGNLNDHAEPYAELGISFHF
jgi:opacity protein-like surface antigen